MKSNLRYSLLFIIIVTFVYPSFESIAQEKAVGNKWRQRVAKSTDAIVTTLPLCALGIIIGEKDLKGLAQGAETAGLALGATLLLKYTVKEQRPNGDNSLSFPSGHAAVSFATATFIGRRYGWVYSIPAYALSAYVGWGRVYSQKHYWWDVAAGAAIGVGSAFVFTRSFAREHSLKIIPMTDGKNVGIYASLNF